jgi:hypothetical protein
VKTLMPTRREDRLGGDDVDAFDAREPGQQIEVHRPEP